MAADKKVTILSIGGIILVVSLMVLGGRFFFKGIGSSIRSKLPEPRIERTAGNEIAETRESGTRAVYEVEEFSDIDVEGIWNITVTKGETYSLAISEEESNLGKIMVVQKNNQIALRQKSGLNFFTGTPVEITMPNLNRLRVEGGSSIKINGFEGDRMEVIIEGMTVVTGNGNRIENLEIDGEGAGTLNFLESSVVNADLSLDGLVNLKLHMAGGVLKGRVEGLCNVKYTGTVSEEAVRIEGLGSVKKID
jgi:hypothetical protein